MLIQYYFRMELNQSKDEKNKNEEHVEEIIINKVIKILIDDIPSSYKMYRKNQYQKQNKDWNLDLLGYLIDLFNNH